MDELFKSFIIIYFVFLGVFIEMYVYGIEYYLVGFFGLFIYFVICFVFFLFFYGLGLISVY